mgnify:CR=1 FL=1
MNNVANKLKSVNVENVVIVLLVCVLVGLVGYYVYQNNNEGFQAQKPELMLFYVDWCPHCTNAKPIVENLKKNNNDVNVRLVNCEEEKDLAKQYNVKAYPTLYLVVGEDRHEFNKRVSNENLEAFIKEHL